MYHSPSQRKLAFPNQDAEKRMDSHTLRLKSFRGDEWYSICREDKTCDCEEFQAKARRLAQSVRRQIPTVREHRFSGCGLSSAAKAFPGM
jgi:hypothetical protein